MFLPAFLLGQLLLLKAPVVLGQQARSSLTTKRLRILDQQDYSERSSHHRQKRVLKKMGKKSQGSKTAKKQKSTSVALSCDTECPCCGTSGFPEFVAAVDSYSADGDSCYVRNEPTSVNVAVFDCNPYLVAYMSYDYSTDTPPEESRYCGDSSSDRKYLTESEAAACDAVLRTMILQQQGFTCPESFGCN